MIDLAGYTQKQLDALVKAAQKRRELLRKRPSVAKVRAEVIRYVIGNGYTIEELFATASPGRTRAAGGRSAKAAKAAKKAAKVQPKYRNPGNPEETWTGRGSKPRWLAAQLAKGKKVEQFLIKR